MTDVSVLLHAALAIGGEPCSEEDEEVLDAAYTIVEHVRLHRSPVCAEALSMRYLDGMSWKAIANEQGVGVRTVQRRVEAAIVWTNHLDGFPSDHVDL